MTSSSFTLDAANFDRLQKAMQEHKGNTEKVINEVLHNEGSPLIQEAIRLLIPESHRDWKGKPMAARYGKSLTDEKGNLSITVKTTSKYHYLYFPDDGSNTVRHAKSGNQQFFRRGGESVQDEIVDRCISRLVESFEQS